jgi:hypothetical protein
MNSLSEKKSSCKQKLVQLLKYNNYELMETDCAELLYILYNDEFSYHNGWYQYDPEQCLWIHVHECIELRCCIPTLKSYIDEEIRQFRKDLDKINNDIRDIEEQDITEENKETLEQLLYKKQDMERKINTLTDTRKQFSKTGFKNNIMKECKDVFLNKTMCKVKDDMVNTVSCISLNPIKSFVRYLLEEYTENIIRLSSNELLESFNEFAIKNKIMHDIKIISLIRDIKKLNIKGITTIKERTGNKTEFNKKEIQAYV